MFCTEKHLWRAWIFYIYWMNDIITSLLIRSVLRQSIDIHITSDICSFEQPWLVLEEKNVFSALIFSGYVRKKNCVTQLGANMWMLESILSITRIMICSLSLFTIRNFFCFFFFSSWEFFLFFFVVCCIHFLRGST